MVLPVGADGKVSFFTDFGATDLAVSVVGYYVDPDAPLSLRRKIAADGGNQFDGVSPQRLDNLSLGASGGTKVTVAGRAGTDPASSSAVLSLTVAAGQGHGSLVRLSGRWQPSEGPCPYLRPWRDDGPDIGPVGPRRRGHHRERGVGRSTGGRRHHRCL